MNEQRLTQEARQALQDIIPENRLRFNKEDIEDYCHDEYPDVYVQPEGVVLAATEEEVVSVLKWSDRFDVPVTPRGSGTGLSGGCLASCGGIVLSLERMKAIKEIDKEGLFVITEPGVITQNLHEAVEAEGLFYPPDPASLDSCSIGGNIAEDAGGPRAYKYGTTRQYVQGLRVVLPNGNLLELGGKLIKNVTGYNLTYLIVGSEGTLGVVTEITLRLVSKPKQVVDLLIPFPSMNDATCTINEFLNAGLVPTTMEFMDKAAVQRSSRFLNKQLPFMDAPAQILVQLEDDGLLEERLELAQGIADKHNAIDILLAENPVQRETIWQARRSLFEALKQSEGSMELADLSIPRHRIPVLIDGIRCIAAENEIEIINYGHAGDGNVHVHVMQNDMPRDVWDIKRKDTLHKLFSLAVSLGGVISGEHGIGLLKKRYIGTCLSDDAIRLMKLIKKSFDPKGLLNPGKMWE